MQNITYKKTFWMNVGLFLLFSLGLFMFFFVNIDYVESKPIEKIMNVLLVLVPLLSLVTFYRNDQGLLLKVTLTVNILITLMVSWFLLRSAYHQSWDSVIFMLIWITPFVINVKQLNELKNA